MFPKSLVAADHFSYFTMLGMDHSYVHVATTALVTLFIAFISLRVHRSYQKATNPIIPDNTLTLRNIAELLVESLYSLIQGVLEDKAAKYFPFLAVIFIYVFLNNILGLVPGFLPSTQSINTGFVIAITVFVYYNMEGIREHGVVNYFKHFMGPIAFLAPLMVVIELISHTVRPFSLSLRLFGNMTGDHQVLSIFSDLTPVFVPIIFLGLGVFVCFLQAFIFTLLSSVYISLAIAHEDH